AGEDWKQDSADSPSAVSHPDWIEAMVLLDPTTFETASLPDKIAIEATEFGSEKPRPVTFDPGPGWHRINLDNIDPIAPPGSQNPTNDALERIRLVLSNPTDREQIARLMFEKTQRGIRQRIGTPVTGISAILRDTDGNPTGIPVQLSKNWHNHAEASVHSGQWFHGISRLRLPPKSRAELELTIAYGHWGGVPAASHAQLSLIGWGGNQLWDQSAIGSWGESICFEPEQVQRGCSVLDVRPLLVFSKKDRKKWGWTNNVGGGDFFRLFNEAGKRFPHRAMRTTYHRQGPCLTEVKYAGKIADGMKHSATVSLGRTDDIVRGTYRIRLDVEKPVEFSRFVIFQVGSDTYNSTAERKLAYGNETGLIHERNTEWGSNVYRTEPAELTGRIPWVSLHEGVPQVHAEGGPIANRGFVIRSWEARLGGTDAAPWIAERGLEFGGNSSSTADLVPPPAVTRLEPGDFVEATIEHVVLPQFGGDYYGPNDALRAALAKHENTWRMVHREAVGNDREIKTSTGELILRFPDIRIAAASDSAEFTLTGGLGYVPVTISGLSTHRDFVLLVDGKPVDQSVHGNDFWQADFDSKSKTWSRTWSLPVTDKNPRHIQLETNQ
ncbi:MAG: hypothetical protein HKN23_01445, partial [Verrucomicrobiales bacterium]|nr:hypothetical protein [Verrucomicrobiales bacterium]